MIGNLGSGHAIVFIISQFEFSDYVCVIDKNIFLKFRGRMRRHHGSCTWFGEHNTITAEFLLVQLASVNNSGPEMVIFLQSAEKNHN